MGDAKRLWILLDGEHCQLGRRADARDIGLLLAWLQEQGAGEVVSRLGWRGSTTYEHPIGSEKPTHLVVPLDPKEGM